MQHASELAPSDAASASGHICCLCLHRRSLPAVVIAPSRSAKVQSGCPDGMSARMQPPSLPALLRAHRGSDAPSADGAPVIRRPAFAQRCRTTKPKFPTYHPQLWPLLRHELAAANQRGIQLMQELIAQYGIDVIQAYMRFIQQQAAAQSRACHYCAPSRSARCSDEIALSESTQRRRRALTGSDRSA